MPQDINIVSLPIELQEEILSNLGWEEHFVAAMVCSQWASILQTERFRRQHYIYDVTNPRRPPKGSPIRHWGLKRYMPDDYGPPWRARSGGHLTLHGLLGSETLMLGMWRYKGQVRSKTLLAIDAVGYVCQPASLGMLRRFYEKRHGIRSLYDITDSPLLSSEMIYFAGDQISTSTPPSPFLNHPKSKKPEDSEDESFSSSARRGGERESQKEGGEGNGKSAFWFDDTFVITPELKIIPDAPPFIRFRNPVRIREFKDNKRGGKANDGESSSNTPGTKAKSPHIVNDFDQTIQVAPSTALYLGERGDSVKELLEFVQQHLAREFFKPDASVIECWAVFDSEPRYLFKQEHDPCESCDPRKNIFLDVTILRKKKKNMGLPHGLKAVILVDEPSEPAQMRILNR
ncbi:hypothetical protein ABW20_dc0107525 [Dactylellina cionopaga]|nr:hypothetical protein ABW20_dc0107525 [Dactylellina cionopaga]